MTERYAATISPAARRSRSDSSRIPLLLNSSVQHKKSEAINELMTLFHIAFMLIGLGIISIGAYVMNTNSVTITTALFVTGGIVTLTSFVGCFGSYMEFPSYLNIYNSIAAVALVMELITVGFAYTHKTKLETYGSAAWDFLQQQDSQFLLEVEHTFACCGYDSVVDRAIPNNTCSAFLNTNAGCKDMIQLNIQQWYQWIVITFIALITVELIALLLSVILTHLINREQKEEEAYLAFLLPSNSSASPAIHAAGITPPSPASNHSAANHHYYHPPPAYQQHDSSSSIHSGMNNSYNGYGRRLPNGQRKPSSSLHIPRYGSTPSANSNSNLNPPRI